VAERLVFRDAAGRELTARDLEGFTGAVRWEIIGAGAVPQQAARLHQDARQAGSRGDYARALALLDQARALAPDWPYPVYDAAFTYLLQGETAKAEELYAHVDAMAPRGFFTCKTTLDMLRRESAGELFPGFSKAYATLEWLDRPRKKAILEGITSKYPAFAPAWKELEALLEDDAGRLHAIRHGLRGNPDPDTRGMLLISKARILARYRDRDTAIAILGELALSPESTLSTEHHAKATFALLITD
jgi:tetratricopeptide (TPR) repeat protein